MDHVLIFHVKLYALKNFEFQARSLHLGDIVSLFELTLDVLFEVVKYNTVALVYCSWIKEAIILTFPSIEGKCSVLSLSLSLSLCLFIVCGRVFIK